MEEDKIELYSEEVEDLLGTPPRWLVRWGITVFFLVITALITLSAFISYPDKVIAKIAITTPYPPSPVITRTEGNLSLKDYTEGQWIDANSILGIIENPANEQDVLALEAEISQIQEFKPAEILDFQPKEKLQLGTLQGLYSEFSTLFENYLFASAAKYDISKIYQLNSQITNIEDLNRKIDESQMRINQTLDASKKLFDRKKELLAQRVIAQDELDKAEETYLMGMQNKEKGDLEKMNNKLRVNEIEREITTIKKGIKLESSTYFVELAESIKRLQAAIKTWKENYLIIASVSGNLSFNPDIKTKMYVAKEVEIAMILPKEDHIIGKINLTMKGSGKVAKEDDVIIKFDGYPYQEYGIVRGKITSKAAVPRNNTFYVEVGLPNGLITSRQDTLKFEQQIEGSAEIITDSRSLLRRIFDQILTALESIKER